MLTKIEPKAASAVPTADQVTNGIRISPINILPVLPPGDWEDFTHEWLWHLKDVGVYTEVNKFSGSGDLGLDVVTFTHADGFDAPWDSYQCKRYDHALSPGDVVPEIVKLIYHSFTRKPPFNQGHQVPRKYVFICPHGIGISVGRLMKDKKSFKEAVRLAWEKSIPKVGKGIVAPLSGALLRYFDDFDFSIFSGVAPVDLIAAHSKTPFHRMRFGGGLPPRPPVEPPPTVPVAAESAYLRKLLEAYGDHLGKDVGSLAGLGPSMINHYDRQRTLFYSAESLRAFARDPNLNGTFAAFQDDIRLGVIDTCEDQHDDGFARLKKVITLAGTLALSGHALRSVATIADQQGVCHQLANDDRLEWINKP
ncbi:ABC-three component system protein [Rhizobium sp. 18055]|uniref:ABC-three component system protein n=1 Tax=Rhizobium sp. 18055 TaxID=2681403 RepID=UPI0013568939|nr:ABC-three component system protein [Rhizobium sp. 18055]